MARQTDRTALFTHNGRGGLISHSAKHNKKNDMERRSALIVGAQRAGKTFLIEKELKQYAASGGVSVVYKPGRPTDYVGFDELELLTPEEYKEIWEKKNRKVMPKYEIPNRIDWFRFKGERELFHLKDFPKMFKGRCVKIKRVFSSLRSEGLFFGAISRYFFNCFVVIDDCSSVFRHGLPAEMRELATTINHSGGDNNAGKGVGVDIAFIFHTFNGVNPEIYGYVNLIIQFKTVFRPNNIPREVEEIEEIIVSNYEYLKKAEKYSHFEYYPHEQENTFFEP